MRMPRVRSTIGRLMVAVLVAGLALWALADARRRGSPTIPERQAEAAYQQALLAREVAEYAVKEYIEGVYLQDKATYQGQVALARADQERAVDRLKWSTETRDEGRPTTPEAHVADQLAKQRADFDLERARAQLDVLETYTKDEQIRSLRADVAKARADEQAKLQCYRRERAKRFQILGF